MTEDNYVDHKYKYNCRLIIMTLPSYANYTNLLFPTKSSLTCCALDSNSFPLRRMSIQAFETLNDLLRQQDLCDTVIRVDNGAEISVHRIILSGKL